jgi:hypothetical protein
MKKILTFLVMLVASVSFLMAQAPQAKFNYQAVVRDRNHDNNLVMNRTIDVTIEILNGDNVVYTEPHTGVQTNRNGMVSFVIGTNATADNNLANLDWSNAVIRATFKEGNTVLSVVKNDVMPVPYALSANVDPLEITTKAICDYIASAQASSVDSIFDAMLAKQAVSDQLKTRIVDYVKTQDPLVRELGIYFLGKVTPSDVEQAYDTLTEDVKEKIKDLTVAYLKSDDGKAVVYDVLEYYLTNTSKTEVQELWAAARANANFHEIFNAVRDSVIDYIKGHKDLVKSVAMYYMTVIDVEDVQDLHAYLKQNNNGVYTYMINKLGDYLNSYLTNEYMAVKECDGKDICDLQAEIDALKSHCPYIEQVSISPSDMGWVFTAKVINYENGLYVTGDNFQVPLTGQSFEGVTTSENVYQYIYGDTLSDGVYTFSIPAGSCPAASKSFTLTNN